MHITYTRILAVWLGPTMLLVNDKKHYNFKKEIGNESGELCKQVKKSIILELVEDTTQGLPWNGNTL